MTSQELKEAIVALPSYEAYWQTTEALTDAKAKSPPSPDLDSIPDLERRIAFLQARQAQALPLANFKIEIAEAEATIPLVYRLSMLAVIDTPLSTEPIFIQTLKRPLPQVNKDLPLGEIAFPPYDPFERAVRIGSVILEVAQKLPRDREVPMAQLSLGKMFPNTSIPTQASYYIVRSGSFILKEPTVHQTSEPPVVIYTLPSIPCVKADYDADAETFEESDDWHNEAVISIPTVEQLMGSANNTQLLFSREALKYARQRQRKINAASEERPEARLQKSIIRN